MSVSGEIGGPAGVNGFFRFRLAPPDFSTTPLTWRYHIPFSSRFVSFIQLRADELLGTTRTCVYFVWPVFILVSDVSLE